MEREHRVVMERIDRMERASQERDARLARVVRELSARIDRVEQAPAKRPAPARGSETVKPMEDEKLRMAVQEVEERMKRVHEMEKKLGERAADLKKTEEKLNERERELRQMAERLKANAVKPDAREKSKPKRETGRSPRKNKDRERDGE